MDKIDSLKINNWSTPKIMLNLIAGWIILILWWTSCTNNNNYESLETKHSIENTNNQKEDPNFIDSETGPDRTITWDEYIKIE